MDSLFSAADRLDATASTVNGAAASLAAADLSPTAFAAASPGQLGELGRALHGQWAAALDARAREAAALADDIGDVALAVRSAARTYADADLAARRRHEER